MEEDVFSKNEVSTHHPDSSETGGVKILNTLALRKECNTNSLTRTGKICYGSLFFLWLIQKFKSIIGIFLTSVKGQISWSWWYVQWDLKHGVCTVAYYAKRFDFLSWEYTYIECVCKTTHK